MFSPASSRKFGREYVFAASIAMFVTLMTCSVPSTARSQGIPGGMAYGAAVGSNVAGPVGAVVGGVVGGAIGGVEGVLGVGYGATRTYSQPYPTYAEGNTKRRYSRRHRRQAVSRSLRVRRVSTFAAVRERTCVEGRRGVKCIETTR